jgi:hypothetical protein
MARILHTQSEKAARQVLSSPHSIESSYSPLVTCQAAGRHVCLPAPGLNDQQSAAFDSVCKSEE